MSAILSYIENKEKGLQPALCSAQTLCLLNCTAELIWKFADHRFIGMVDQGRQFLGGKLGQVNGVPVWLLCRGTVITPNHNAGICVPKGLAGKGGAFKGDFVRINLGKNLSLHFDAEGPFSEWIIFIGTGF